ncbi:MAG: hypothetical protein AAGE84_19750 [Cyanobacteria bacterium P01_G01_bin.39]
MLSNRRYYQIEDIIKNELIERGIKVQFGKYYDSPDEIDIVVETSDTIIFFELKAKPLIRKSRVGKDLDLFIDLSESLLHSQYQANKHELFLRKEGYIHFKNSDYKLHFKDKKIIKISISLLDFGSYQDRDFVFQFLRCMLAAKLQSDNDAINTKLGKINNMITQFQINFAELTQLESQYESKPFFNCYYLSLPQLLIILDQISSEEDLKNEICKLRNASFSTMDFYQEYKYINTILK